MTQSRPEFRYKKPPPVRRGRKKGRVPFLQDKKRFHAVLISFLRFQFQMPKDRAIEVSIMLLDSDSLLQITAYPEGIAKASDVHFGLENRSDYLKNTCDDLLGSALDEKDSFEWVQDSLGALALFVRDFQDLAAGLRWLAILKGLGWDVERVLAKFGGQNKPIPMASPGELKAFRSNRAQNAGKRLRQIDAVNKNLRKLNIFQP